MVAKKMGKTTQEVNQMLSKAQEVVGAGDVTLNGAKSLLDEYGVPNDFIDDLVQKYSSIAKMLGMSQDSINSTSAQLKNRGGAPPYSNNYKKQQNGFDISKHKNIKFN